MGSIEKMETCDKYGQREVPPPAPPPPSLSRHQGDEF